MDGVTDFEHDGHAIHQHTIKTEISCIGTALHSGRRTRLRFSPAPVNHGIVFHRTDLGVDLPARYDMVTDTRLCTRIAHPVHTQASVGTVEHVMAALAATGVDNAIVSVDGPEIPVLDGSSLPFVFLLDCAGRVRQAETRQAIEILRPIRVTLGEAFAELRPGGAALDMNLSIDFPASAIGRQELSLSLSEERFRNVLAGARTFTMLNEIKAMQAAGLAQGGSLDNAVVVDGDRVLNPSGLRSPDEFVRHKMLDAVGDLALVGAPIHGFFVAHRSGHALNNMLLRALFADSRAWRMVSLDQTRWSKSSSLMTAKAA